MKIGGIVINWFDFVVLAIVTVGLFRGRNRGISEELLDLMKWLVVVVVAAQVYQPLGGLISEYTHVGPTTGYVAAYLSILLIVRAGFNWIKRMVGEKLIGSDVFGSWEYYLGMLAGAARFACVLLISLAFLNAAYVSPEKLAAQSRMQKENFGDISFPTIGTLHQTVFAGSASGKFVKDHLSYELIVPNIQEKRRAGADTLGRRREQSLNEILDDRK